MRKSIVLVVSGLLLAACSSGGSTATTPTPTPTPTTTPSVSASGTPPTAEQTAWAGQVCTAAGALKTSITGLATAATAGGGDVKDALAAQLVTIKSSVATLVDTVTAAPAGSADDPDLAAVKSAADQLKSSLDGLEQSVAAIQGATSAAQTVAALAGVVTAASTSLTALSATTQAITTAAQDAKGTLGQAFAANPACTALTP